MLVETPWGRADGATLFAEGIVFYYTPSHGGFGLSPERVEKIHPALRNLFNGPDWYEEDCEWAAVAITFPEVFVGRQPDWGNEAAVRESARAILQRYYPAELALSEAR